METEEKVCYDEFLELSVEELKFYLRQRGHNVTGSKRDLAARALVSFENKEKPLKDDKLHEIIRKEYNTILELNHLADPLEVTSGWENDMKSWPSLDLGRIFHYILERKAFDTDYVGQYKVRKAYSYFKSGFVSQIVSLKLDGINKDRAIFKTSVLPSQKVSCAPHTVWILIDKSGTILTAYCSCTAGLSRCCNHVIAALYKINFAVSEGLTNPSCTEVKSKFNDMSKKVIKGCKIKDITFEKHVLCRETKKPLINSTVKRSFDPRGSEPAKINEELFFEKLRDIKPTSCVLLYCENKNEESMPPALPELAAILRDEITEPYEFIVDKFMSSLCFTDAQLAHLERVTRQQAACKEWYVQRKGRLTASVHKEIHDKVAKILSHKSNVVTTPVIAKVMGLEKDLKYLPQIRWGNRNEENAAAAFFKVAMKEHEMPQISSCGIFLCPQFQHISASPDRIMTCKCCPASCIEIKCPFSLKETAFNLGWQHLGFMEKAGDQIVLKKSHKYYAQVQGQMACSGCERSYFVVWDPVSKVPHIEVIMFDKQF